MFDPTQVPLEASPTGQFIGQIRRIVSTSDMEIGYWTAGAETAAGEHGHRLAHLLFVTSGRYITPAARDHGSEDQLFYHPPNTWHDDHLAAGQGSFLSLTFQPEFQDRLEADGVPTEARRIGSTTAAVGAWSVLRALSAQSDRLVLEALALELVFSAMMGEGFQDSDRRWLKRARDALSEPRALHGSIADLSRQLGVHPVHMTREFKQRFGCTPGQYNLSRRLQAAGQALTQTDAPIAEIASLYGFSDQSHFSRRFQRMFGITPGRHRKLTRRTVRGFVSSKTT